MTAFITGGTGFLGSYILRLLVQKGVKVRALKRATSRLDLVQDVADQVEWIEGDVLDLPVLYDAIKGVDEVYHVAAIVSYDPRDRAKMMQTNVEGTANIVNICLDEGVKKLCHVSSIGALGKNKNGDTVSEKSKWQFTKYHNNYGLSKYQSEQEVWRGIAEGLNAVIINPSIIMGGGFWEVGSCGFFTKIWNGLPFYPEGATGFVDVRDVAKIAIELMESDIQAERYLINGENLDYHTFFTMIANGLGKKVPSIKVTKIIREVAWRLEYLKSFITRKRPMITKETVHSSSTVFYYDNTKVKNALNYSFIPLRETLQETGQLFVATKNAGQDYGVLDF